jgi:hypothetical protein
LPPFSEPNPGALEGKLSSLALTVGILAALLVGASFVLYCAVKPTSKTSQQKAGSVVREFDPDSAEWSLRWLAEQARAVERVCERFPNNDLAFRQAVEQLEAKLQKLSGLSVRWNLPVERVNQEGVWLDSLEYQAPDASPDFFGPPSYTLSPYTGQSGQLFSIAMEDWVLRLKKGDRVSLQGSIDRVSFDLAGRGGMILRRTSFSVSFGRYRLGPASD